MKGLIALGALAAIAAACTSTPTVKVPQTLAPGSYQVLALTVPARGAQIYECRIGRDGAGFEWAFVAPDAELFDERSRSIGTHGAGPFWQSNDGSRVIGTVKARVDAPVPGAVPWLLLATKSNGPDGLFSRVSHVQRVNTSGGIAPVVPCTEGLQGKSVRVPYTADYLFFTPR